MKHWKKIGVGILVAVAALLVPVFVLARPDLSPSVQAQGVTFSQPQATGIGLDWREAYNALLQDLGVRELRLSAYWDVIEPEDDGFDFSTLDYQMDQAQKYDAQVILSIGRKVPRWPECHIPKWAQALPEPAQQDKVLEMLPVVIERYKDHPALRMWQLENEPLLEFGICPLEDRDFFAEEEALLRSLDPDHLILVTDSGELNSWLGASKYGDILGTTMYRTVFSERTQKHFYYDYIFPAWGYRFKARYVDLFRGKDVLISELQGEPWGAAPFVDMTEAEREQAFSIDRFKTLRAFALRTQLPEAYWWGVEYWYWEKEVKGDSRYWDYAKTIFADGS